MENCPICNYSKYRYVYYTEEYWGIVEQHGYCKRCGYTIEQAYSGVIEGFTPPSRRGWRDRNGEYHTKNIRQQKRMKRKYNLKYDNNNWMLNFI